MLGHILLGHMNLNVFFCNYSEENKKLEKEAISFAYELLLPKKEFREYALKYNNSVRCLADIFFRITGCRVSSFAFFRSFIIFLFYVLKTIELSKLS